MRLTVIKNPAFDVSKLPELLASHRGMFTIHPYPDETYFLYHGDRESEKMLSELKTFSLELAETSNKG